MCLSPVAWMPEKTRIEFTSSESWEYAGCDQRTRRPSARASASPAGPRPATAGGEGHGHRIDEKEARNSRLYTDCSDHRLFDLVADLLARVAGAAAAGVARCGRGGGRARAAEGEPAARLRRRGARPPREPRAGD